ncbi:MULTISPECIES: histidine kinase [Bradyrhizobium]|nr:MULTISPECIES: histidine kinase [Bradyrhizobium]
MWKNLSLRMRLLLPLGAMFLAALLLGGLALQLFAPAQLMDENEPAQRSAKAVAEALDSALRMSANPEQTLDAFVQALGTSEAIRFRRAGTPLSAGPVDIRTPLGRVPHWFIDIMAMPDVSASFPVTIKGKQIGEIMFAPDISADLYEKWIGFLALLSSGIALMLLTGSIAYFITGAAVGPLQNLGEGLTRMRSGDYARLIPSSGPPEIRRSSEEANELAKTLRKLSQDNRSLLRKIVSLQDDERQDIARDLHDELGPLLFGIRANTVALMESLPPDRAGPEASAQGILQSVEALQYANRRILDRLRPLYIQELGLERSIHTLLHNARAQAPDLQLSARIDPGLNAIDGLLSQTVYRVIQEAVTNVLRHANARSVQVTATRQDRELTVEISDDGIGFAAGQVFGRGLTGMQERVRALSGTFELLRENGRSLVRCRLPAISSEIPAPREA